MSPWVWAPWLPWALLLIHVPGSLSRRSSHFVDGTVGGSLSVQCTYEQKDKNNSKFWCRSPCWTPWGKVVELSGTQREARRGRMTIRDEPANLTFTVTLENLTEDDVGMYWCGVSRPASNKDLLIRVAVSVFPAFTTASHAAFTTPGPQLEPDEPTRKEPPDLSPNNDPEASGRGHLGLKEVVTADLGDRGLLPAVMEDQTLPETSKGPLGSLLSSVHFLLLIFLKVPLLLGMMGAVLWVSWPQRGPTTGGERHVMTRRHV